MGLHEYQQSIELGKLDPPFYALIMAAMRKADTDNMAALERAFPAVAVELRLRYNAPGGLIGREVASR